MLTRGQKEEQVAEFRDKFERATSVFVADYRGLDVPQMEALRGGLREAEGSEAEFCVAKNSVLRLASTGGQAEGLQEHFQGTTSIAMSFGDPVALAKTLVDYAKENEAFELRSAVLDGKVLDTKEISTLATLPSLDELRGKIVGLLQAPAGNLARLMTEPAGQMARIVAARESALGSGEAAGGGE
jgi:large subunit ribosomal protein L10